MSSRHAQDELKRGPRASWAAWPVAPPEWLLNGGLLKKGFVGELFKRLLNCPVFMV
tara:strand:+ start:79 stop:246 length:168 start_codon:yes stop_codon:yes gene_type:complete